MGDLYKMFPKEEGEFWRRALREQERMTELRLRADQPALAYCGGREFFLRESGEFCDSAGEGIRFSRERLKNLLLHLCKYSLYAYEEELREGYVTLEGGHRLGVAGQVVLEEGRIRTIKNISFLNLRIAHQITGAADAVLPYVYQGDRVRNSLIVSPPGVGKTTLLRDLVRQISEGNTYGSGRTVGVVDERSEIAGSYLGVPQSDLGMRTDVMDGCPKVLGMDLLIRSMAPKVLAVDEIGGGEDLQAIRRALTCGISVIATIHGNSREDIQRRDLGECFEVFFFLERSGSNAAPNLRECVCTEELFSRGIGIDTIPRTVEDAYPVGLRGAGAETMSRMTLGAPAFVSQGIGRETTPRTTWDTNSFVSQGGGEKGLPNGKPPRPERSLRDENDRRSYDSSRLYGSGTAIHFRTGQAYPETGGTSGNPGAPAGRNTVQQDDAPGVLSAVGK